VAVRRTRKIVHHSIDRDDGDVRRRAEVSWLNSFTAHLEVTVPSLGNNE
jgi:hypothetical protein